MRETINQLLRTYEEMEWRLEQNRDKMTVQEARLYTEILHWRRKQCTKAAEALRTEDTEIRDRLAATATRFGGLAEIYEQQLQEIINEVRNRNE